MAQGPLQPGKQDDSQKSGQQQGGDVICLAKDFMPGERINNCIYALNGSNLPDTYKLCVIFSKYTFISLIFIYNYSINLYY